MSQASTPSETQQKLIDRLFQSTIGTLELYSVFLGKRLGLYGALVDGGAATPGELAQRAGIDERYAREWLEQQAVAGLLIVDDESKGQTLRRYAVPEEHVGVLFDTDHSAHVAPFSQMIAGIGSALPRVAEAYRTGAGVPYEAYGSDFRCGQGGINRPAFTEDLPERWIPAITDIDERLRNDPPARIADVGCGEGWSTIALSRAYPNAEVVGIDIDSPSISAAKVHAQHQGASARFRSGDATALAESGPYDVILVLEALHDMAQPTEALAAFRRALNEDGSVIVVDERVANEFTAPGDDIERMMYGWSVVHCLPVARAEQPSEALGTVLRADMLVDCATRAGFGSVQVLPIENDLFRFYRLRAA